QALFRRAVALARVDYPWLAGTVISSTSGCVQWTTAAPSPALAAEGTISLLGHFLTLLDSLIGFDLTARMMQRIWPDA
ncbi:MAG: hypothetical protein LC772_02475, partial [Chloroflexi bacterium]|nr:hypothetical protein [Chloroflexota bacterium]